MNNVKQIILKEDKNMKKFKTLLIVVMVLVTALVATLALVGCDKGNYLKVVTNAEFDPFEYMNMETGNIEGFDIDYIDAIAKQMGYDGAKVTSIDFDSVVPSVQKGKKYDVAIAGLTVTEERTQQVDFTNPYYDAGQTIIYKGDVINFENEDEMWNFLKGKKIGVAKGYTGDILIQKEMKEGGKLYGSGADRKAFDNGSLAVTALAGGERDVVVIDNAPAKALAKTFADKGVKVVTNVAMGSEKYAIAVKKGNTELLDKINAAMLVLEENGTYIQIWNKYFDKESNL